MPQPHHSKTFIISLGGSVISSEKLNVQFLKQFRKLLISLTKKGYQFLIIPGGGQTCRTYQKAAQTISKISNDDLDWIGIATNRLHTYFLHAIFGKEASPEIIMPDSRISDLKKSISICIGGLAPGGTSDSVAVRFAQRFGATTIVNLTNVTGVYDRDPNKFKSAKLIPELTWTELKKQFGTKKIPGRHMPFDATVADQAQNSKITAVLMNGRDLKNFQNYLSGKNFRGTVIS